MLIPNQYIEITWSHRNKQLYVDKGYEFTKYGDVFLVRVEDVPSTNNRIKIQVQCDYCGDVISKTPYDYYKGIREVNKCACNKQECQTKKSVDVTHSRNAAPQMERFYKICEDVGYIPLSTVDDYKNVTSEMRYICPIHGEQKTPYTDFVNAGHRCIQCGHIKTSESKRHSIDEVIAIVEGKNGNKLLNPEDYKNAKEKNLLVQCGSCGKISLRSLSAIMNSNGACEDCKNEKVGGWNKYTPEDVKRIVESKNGNKVLNPDDYVDMTTKNLLIQCGSCGRIMVRSLYSIAMSQNGECEYCVRDKKSQNMRMSKEEVKERIESVHNNKWLNPDEYINCEILNLQIQCGECGNIYTTSLKQYEWEGQNRCPQCSGKISKLEQKVKDFLDYYEISYEREKRFEDCKDIICLPFDFYLPDYNLIIETDGQGHYDSIFGEEHFLKTLLHDGMKNNYCKWNNIELLRIPYFKGNEIEKILSQKLDVDNKFDKPPYPKQHRQHFEDKFKNNKATQQIEDIV